MQLVEFISATNGEGRVYVNPEEVKFVKEKSDKESLIAFGHQGYVIVADNVNETVFKLTGHTPHEGEDQTFFLKD